MSEKRTGDVLRVASVKPGKKAVSVLLSDGTKLSLTENTFTDFALYAGKELSEKDRAKIESLSKQDAYYEFALKCLARENYTVHEIWAKLEAKGVEEETIRSIVKRLVKSGLLDDEQYAYTYSEDVAELRMLGCNRVRYDLHRKGISDEIINRLPFSDGKELQRAVRYASTLDRKLSKTPSAKKAYKAISALIERGFDEKIAEQAAFSCLTPNDPADERARLLRAYDLAHARYAKKYGGYDLEKRIFAYLIGKGYSYEDVKALVEEKEHEQ